MAGFEVTLHGRFWVSAEAIRTQYARGKTLSAEMRSNRDSGSGSGNLRSVVAEAALSRYKDRLFVRLHEKMRLLAAMCTIAQLSSEFVSMLSTYAVSSASCSSFGCSPIIKITGVFYGDLCGPRIYRARFSCPTVV